MTAKCFFKEVCLPLRKSVKYDKEQTSNKQLIEDKTKYP